MAFIRRYRTIAVTFLTLVFLVYARYSSGVHLLSDSNKTEQVIFKNSLAFIQCNNSLVHSERLGGNTPLLKKISIDKVAFRQLILNEPHILLLHAQNNVLSASAASILKLICILRI